MTDEQREREPYEEPLAQALYGAHADQECAQAGVERHYLGEWTELDDDQRRFWRGVANRLLLAGAVTMLGTPEDPDDDGLVIAVKGIPESTSLARAVNVAAVQVGWVTTPSGKLALLGQFVGNRYDQANRQVAVAYVLSATAAAGLIRQIIESAGATNPAVAGDLGTVAQRAVLDVARRAGGEVLPVIRPEKPGTN